MSHRNILKPLHGKAAAVVHKYAVTDISFVTHYKLSKSPLPFYKQLFSESSPIDYTIAKWIPLRIMYMNIFHVEIIIMAVEIN